MEDLYNKASLVLTPQMVEAGKVYSMRPEDRKGDFTFSRSTAATRVNASGNIEKETGNLLTQSNTFSSWSFTTGSSVTGNQAGYDGTNDAWLLTDSGNIGSYAMYNTINDTGILTASIYAKAASTSEIELDLFGTPTPAVKVNLISGNITSVSASNIDAKSVDVGNGWYRISLTCNISSLLYIRIGCDGAGSIYIQDAQLEQGLVARNVITTTTTAIYGGITDNVPRLDYTDSSCPALLLEPQRTNLVPHSEYFGDWGTFRSSITANDATSPENYTNSYKLIQQSGETTSGGIFKEISVATSTAYTYSFFAKAAGYNWCYARVIHSSDNFYAWFDLDNGVVGNTTGSGVTSSIEDYGSGWYKCSITYTSTTTLSNLHIYIADTNGSGTLSNPDGVKGIHIYGAQLEAGSYATSYIPTYGSAVTRNVDACQVENRSALINSEQGTMYFEGIAIDPSFANVLSFSDGTNNNRISLTLPQNATNINAFSSVGGSKIDNYILHDPSINSKYAIVWNGNSFKVFVNGVKKVDNTMAGSFSASTLTDIRFDRGDGGLNFGGFCKSYLSIASALTDQEAIDLTTIG